MNQNWCSLGMTPVIHSFIFRVKNQKSPKSLGNFLKESNLRHQFWTTSKLESNLRHQFWTTSKGMGLG